MATRCLPPAAPALHGTRRPSSFTIGVERRIMRERLRSIAGRHGIGDEALRELTELYESALPRVPTRRTDDHDASHGDPVRQAVDDTRLRYQDAGGIGIGGFSEVREVWDL